MGKQVTLMIVSPHFAKLLKVRWYWFFWSYLKTDDHFLFLNLKNGILVTENFLEIEDVLCKVWKLRGLEGQEGHFWLARVALKISKVKIKWKVKCSSVWKYDKTPVPSDKNVPLYFSVSFCGKKLEKQFDFDTKFQFKSW